MKMEKGWQLCCIVAWLAAGPSMTTLSAQSYQQLGTLLRTGGLTYSRGNLGTAAGQLLQRFDARDTIGIGVDPAQPGMMVIHGVLLGAREFGFSVSPTIDITLYAEDPARPHYPLLSQPLGGAAGVPPPNSLVRQPYQFVPPVLAPTGRDLFVGITVSAITMPIGGVNIGYLPGSGPLTEWDEAGAGMPSSPPEENSYRLSVDTAGNVTYLSRGQFLIDLLTLMPSGYPCSLANQSTHRFSLVVPGATTMMSGLHPDAASPSLNAGRADDPGFLFADTDLPVGSAVFFVASFQGFGPVTPLANYVSGSVGSLCLDLADAEVIGVEVLNTSNQAWHMTPIPAAVRLLIAGNSWAQQAIGVHPSTGVWRGSACSRQLF